ncbi:MAG: hypothetical protein H6834_18460 [Planctomycetes bacterium]|nr:hypothetical protein [Planctomycetota bacterium]
MKPTDQRRARARAFGEARRERREQVALAELESLAESENALESLAESGGTVFDYAPAEAGDEGAHSHVYIFRPRTERLNYDMAAGGGHSDTRNISFRIDLGMQLTVAWDEVSLQLAWRQVSDRLAQARLLVRFRREQDGATLRPDVIVPVSEGSWPRPRQSPGFDTRSGWTLEIVAIVDSDDE